MLKIIRNILSVIVFVLGCFILISQNFKLLPYSVFIVGILSLIVGFIELKKDIKSYWGFLNIGVSMFAIFVAIYTLWGINWEVDIVLDMRKMALVMACFLLMSILGACGFTVEQNEEFGEGTTGDANGTVPAGQEAPEIVGFLKSIETKEEVIITVGEQDVHYRLSEEAKSQIEGKEVDIDSEVTFTTYSIGDDQETIDEFIIK
ncbi:DUF3953 domain-containing protein [Halalkalibacter urbisdiaboli]|uniref:DUF3953 domain-containing protein n=1 Tax=Halalkalibacter urbisdiaboli TaxID=1960589 RepID=UPI001056873C|nr:DUF3953 domain-containing protein [Halalkalibacter urbisdiaboli]